MLEFLRTSKDDYATTDLVGKVSELAEKYPFNTSGKMLKSVVVDVTCEVFLCWL